jgi:SAM-dependent methyltransferase
MTTAFDLIRRALSREVPARAVLWGVLNMINRNLGTGNRRFEFERLYLDHEDPWSYRSSEYERLKYQRTLESILQWRHGARAVLEIGCSIGVFSKILSPHFERCTAIDISIEALRAATNYNRDAGNIRFLRQDLRSMDLGTQFDVIVCAEILYYILEKDSVKASQTLSKHLAPDGIIVCVAGCSSGESDPGNGPENDPMYFSDWQNALSADFSTILEDDVEDPLRPYRIVVLSRRDAPGVLPRQ